MKFSTPQPKKKDVDLTPMVSIVFLLIIFFLIAGTVRSPAFWKIDLPQSSSEDKVNPKMLSIYLNKEGDFAYEKQSVSIAHLKKSLSQQGKDAILQIHADQRVDSLKLVQLLEALQRTVVNRIVLVTQTEPTK